MGRSEELRLLCSPKGPRVYRALALVVQIFEEFMSRDFRAALHDGGYPLVLDPKFPLFARLACEVEPKDAAAHRNVLSSHGGEPVGFVFLGILGVADPDQSLLQKTDDRGQNLLAR